MAHDVLMPQLGMAQNTAVIVSWAKSLGDAVSAGEVLMEVETDKSTVEVEAAHDGFLVDVRAEPGAEVPVGDVIAVISDDSTETISTGPPTIQEPTTDPIQPVRSVVEKLTASNTNGSVAFPTGALDRILASPKAKREASHRELDLKDLVSGGMSQPIHFSDVVNFQPAAHAPDTVVSLGQFQPGCYSIKVLRQPFVDFCQWLEKERPDEIHSSVIWMALAARAYQREMSLDLAPEIQCDYFAPNLSDMPVSAVAVENSLLSAIETLSGRPAGDIAIYDFSASSITGYVPDIQSQKVALVVSATEKNLKVNWHYNRSKVDNGSAMRMAENLAQLLNHPLQILA